jgi:hypothetical protein
MMMPQDDGPIAYFVLLVWLVNLLYPYVGVDKERE